MPTDAEHICANIGVPGAFSSETASYHHSNPTVFPCTEKTVKLAASIYKVDVKYLGYSFNAAMSSCKARGLTS